MSVWMILCAVLLPILCASIYFNCKHAMIILEFQEKIENSLDILDEKYASISSILEKPVFFDSLEIREVIKDISSSRDAILHIANDLCSIDQRIDNEESPDLELQSKTIDG